MLDECNRNTVWADAIAKEIKDEYVAFKTTYVDSWLCLSGRNVSRYTALTRTDLKVPCWAHCLGILRIQVHKCVLMCSTDI